MLTLFYWFPFAAAVVWGNFFSLSLKNVAPLISMGDNLLSTLKDGKEPQGPLCLTILPLQQRILIFKMNQCMNVKNLWVSLLLKLPSEHFLSYLWIFHRGSGCIWLFTSWGNVNYISRDLEVIFDSILVSLVFLFLCLRKDTLKHWNKPLGKWILIFLHLQDLTCFCFPWGVYSF